MENVDGANQIMTHIKAINIAHRTLAQCCWRIFEWYCDEIGVDVGLYLLSIHLISLNEMPQLL